MRWFVEVSRVGENSSDEKYCVEAKQWQAALQEARKLRGDSGPLSKFSIELLDDGYRAVDPKLKLRFVVAKAPQDAELSTESQVRPDAHLNGQASPSIAPSSLGSIAPVAAALPRASVAAAALPSTAPSSLSMGAPAASAPVVVSSPAAAAPSSPAPGAVAIAAAPAPVPATAAAPVVIAAPVEPAAAPAQMTPARPAEPHAGVPSSALSPQAPASAVHVISPGASAAPAAAAQVAAGLTAATPATTKPSAAFPPRPGSVRPPSVKPPGGITVPADVIPAAPAVPQGLGPAVALPQAFTQPSAAMDMPPPSSILRKRQEEPTVETPITYREVAYVVEPGVSRGSVEALLWASFRDLTRQLAERTGQKFIQLAVFDHKFEKRPERPPLGTLAWKDWRGNPVLTFPFFDGTAPARASVPAPSIKPVPVVTISSPPPPAPAAEVAPAAAPAVASAAPQPVVVATASPASTVPAPVVVAPTASPTLEPAPVTLVTPPVVEAPPAVIAPPAAAAAEFPAPTVVAAPAPAPAAEPKSDAQAVAIPLTREKMPSQPSSARASKPRLPAVRRRAGEDLIGELFETMHELHFMRGVADGAEFMLAAVDSIVPCDGVLIHVFDINTRQFVVVRAKGPGAMQALLHRTPDTDPFFHAVMRRPGCVAVQDVASEPRVLGPRWEALGVQPVRALCGGVRQGGRYLGLLELINPLGDAPFHQTEQNAVDYVCEQFAEFLVNRPIVLDADVILKR